MATPDELALALTYGPQTAQSFQRSQYLADALRNIQASTSNMRSPAEMWTKLLADAVLQWGRNRNDKQMLSGLDAYQQQRGQAALSGLDAVTQPPGGLSAPSGPAPAPTPVPQIAPSAPSASAWLTPNVVRAVEGEAAGEPLAGQQAVASAILRRSQESGLSPDQVVTAPGQFEGMNAARAQNLQPGSSEYQRIASNIAGAQPGPYDQFYSPGAQKALGRQPPAWDDGTGTMIGHQLFFNHGYAAPPGMQPAGAGPAPGAPPPAPMPAGGAPPQPQTAAIAPPPSPVAGGGGAPGGVQAAPPTYQLAKGVTPAQVDLARRMINSSDPRVRQQGIEYAYSLQTAAVQPRQWTITRGGDGQVILTDPLNGQSHVNAPTGAEMAAGPLQSRQPDGSFAPVPGTGYGPLTHMAGTSEFGQIGPGGKYVSGPQMAFDPKAVNSIMGELTSSQEYQKYSHASTMYKSAALAATRPGGISDAELIDYAAQEFSGGVARQFNQKMIENAQGVVPRLTQIPAQALIGQRLTPQTRQQLLMAMRDYAAQAQGAFSNVAQSRNAFTTAQGFPLDPYLKPLTPDLPNVPNLGQIPSGMGGPPQPGQQPPAPAPGGQQTLTYDPTTGTFH